MNADAGAAAAARAGAGAPAGVLVTSHACDVSDEAQVLRFRDELLEEHASDHVDLVFANAGIGGGSSFIGDSRQEWERTFAIDWWGVYYCARAFLPLLIASGDGVLVNTSSVNGLWASLGPGMPQTAYSAAKFAVRGFSEALIEDLRVNAPQVRVAVVMPGHVGTDIVANSFRARGLPGPEHMSDAQLEELIPRDTQSRLIRAGLLAEGASAGDLRQMLVRANADFRDKAPVSAAQAVAVILDGVRSGAWRILVGEDAKMIDAAVRANPEAAYDYAELFAARQEATGRNTWAVGATLERGGLRAQHSGVPEAPLIVPDLHTRRHFQIDSLATADGRTYVVGLYRAIACQSRLYQFTLSRGGKPGPLIPFVPLPVIRGAGIGSMVFSASGRELAFSTVSGSPACSYKMTSTHIGIVNLVTRAHGWSRQRLSTTVSSPRTRASASCCCTSTTNSSA